MGLNLFDNCVAECVGKKSIPFFPWGHSKMYTPGTIANSQTDWAPTKKNKNGAATKVRILVELQIL